MKTANDWNNILWSMIGHPDVDAGMVDTQKLIQDIQIDALKYVGYVVDKSELDKINMFQEKHNHEQLIEEIEEITRTIDRRNDVIEQLKTERTILRKKYYDWY